MLNGVIERINAAEIIRVQSVLTARFVGDFHFQKRRQRIDKWLQKREARHRHFITRRMQLAAQTFVENGIEDWARVFVHFLKRARQRFFAAHQAINMLLRLGIDKLRAYRARHCLHGFTRAV